MKDYSLNKKDRKDFILNFDITKDGKIIVNFAGGRILTLPYNQKNEQILISKMEEQVKKASGNEKKYIDKKDKYLKWFYRMLVTVVLSTIFILTSEIVWMDTIYALILSFSVIYGVSFIAQYVHMNNLLEDLQKNQRFLELQNKINKNIRSKNNVLVDVSKNTRDIIKSFPIEKEVFNVNSFNFVSERDLETIIENIDRNERFGFDYTEQEQPIKGVTKKRTRKIIKN